MITKEVRDERMKKIFEILKTGEKTHKEIVEMSNLTGQAVGHLLKQLVNQNKIKKEEKQIGRKRIYHYTLIS